MPLTATFAKIKEAVSEVRVRKVAWLTDKTSGGFYGSCVVLLSSPLDMLPIFNRSTSKDGIKIDKRRIKVAEMFRKDSGEDLFCNNFEQKEYPPVGSC